MSTAQDIVDGAYSALGVKSELQTLDSSLETVGLSYLISLLEELKINQIILEETVNDVTTTISTPAALDDELDEPAASTLHLINLLAPFLTAPARVDLAGIKVPPVPITKNMLARMYRKPDIPQPIPSKLMPRGQGYGNHGRTRTVFFQGEALDADSITDT